ncbi:hypothetical protein [Streptomyces sp. NPDC101165]|uniref:hypothetical protein n=1 Tax=Streptomyces sp. NPDC101165 TaxID=3366119 RepID=UPI0037FD5509
MTTISPAPGSKESLCDHTSVGVLISSPSGLLVFDRVTPPAGLAPVAGHVDQLQEHALRTASYADGHLSREEFEREPGLEPVWCRFLHDLELITLSSVALDRIDAIL